MKLYLVNAVYFFVYKPHVSQKFRRVFVQSYDIYTSHFQIMSRSESAADFCCVCMYMLVIGLYSFYLKVRSSVQFIVIISVQTKLSILIIVRLSIEHTLLERFSIQHREIVSFSINAKFYTINFVIFSRYLVSWEPINPSCCDYN